MPINYPYINNFPFSAIIKFEGNDEKKSGIEITQFQLNIAWAATIHNMEGQTKKL